MIETFDDRFNGIVIDKYHGIFIDISFHPDLHPPPVTVEIGAFPLVMEEAMTCVKMDILVNPGFHYKEYDGTAYNIIINAVLCIEANVENSNMYKFVTRVYVYLSESTPQ